MVYYPEVALAIGSALTTIRAEAEAIAEHMRLKVTSLDAVAAIAGDVSREKVTTEAALYRRLAKRGFRSADIRPAIVALIERGTSHARRPATRRSVDRARTCSHEGEPMTHDPDALRACYGPGRHRRHARQLPRRECPAPTPSAGPRALAARNDCPPVAVALRREPRAGDRPRRLDVDMRLGGRHIAYAFTIPPELFKWPTDNRRPLDSGH